MRLSRSRISIGADAHQRLAAQQIAQNPSLAPKSVKSPELSSVPLSLPPVFVGVQQPKAAVQPLVPPPPPPPPPVAVSKLITPSPPPAPVVVPSFTPPPPPPQVTSEDKDLHRPTFKDPAPEFDGLPPRPSFKEPPPESDDLPTRPTFADPAPENFDIPAMDVATPPPPPLTPVIPPTPQKPASGHSTPTKIASRSPSPPDNIVLGTGKSTISRTGSAQSTTTGRGQRLMRGPRTPGGNVQNLVQNLNRTGSPPNPGPVVTPSVGKLNRLSGGPVKRPSSVTGRPGSAFSRRTDTEDEVFDRK